MSATRITIENPTCFWCPHWSAEGEWCGIWGREVPSDEPSCRFFATKCVHGEWVDRCPPCRYGEPEPCTDPKCCCTRVGPGSER